MSAISTVSVEGMRRYSTFLHVPSRKQVIPVDLFHDRDSIDCDGLSYFNLCIICTSPVDQKRITRHFQIETDNKIKNETEHLTAIQELIQFSLLPLIQDTQKKKKTSAQNGIKLDDIFKCSSFTATPRYDFPTPRSIVIAPTAPREEKKI